MNILIVEDEKLAVRKLRKLLEVTAPEFVVKAVTPSIAATVEWILENRSRGESEPEIIFLDIELADGQSFEIFNQVKIKSVVIFTTSYDEYALHAFKVNSIDYLLKPVQLEDLQRSIQKFYDLKNLGQNQLGTSMSANLEGILKNLKLNPPAAHYRKRFLVKQGSRMISVEIGDIAYFYIEDAICFFRSFQGQRFVIDYKMDEIMEFLDPENFFRVNRGLIVTHQSVTQIQSYFNNRLSLTLKPVFEKQIIVSRERVNDFKNWMGK